jgi:hypothetical protein
MAGLEKSSPAISFTFFTQGQRTMAKATTAKKATKAARVIKAKNPDSPAVLSRDQYNGNPMLVFRLDDEDRYAFQFGKAKANRLLACIDKYGVDHVVSELRNLAGGD